jgi:voltage-gated potassium channel
MQASIKTMVRGLIFFSLTWAIAIAGYRSAGWSALDAVYMTTITVFGVGFGEIGEMSAKLRVFTMFVILAGCSSTAYVIGGFVQMLAEGQINRVLGARRMTKGIHLLADHTLLCGYGRVGMQLAKELQDYGQKFVIIDSNLDALREAEAQGYLVLVGDCTDEEVLKKAGIDRARAVASVLSDDAANVFLTLTARELNSSIQIIARAENPATEKKLLRSGANRVVLPTAIGATKIASLIARPPAEELLMQDVGRQILNEELEQLGLQIQEFAIEITSRLVGQKIARIETNSHGGYLIIAIHRHDGSMLRQPPPDTVLNTGDTMMVLGHPKYLETLAFKAAPTTVTMHRGHAQ